MVIVAEIFGIAIEMTVPPANLEAPLLFGKVAMKLISFAELFVIGRRFNSSPAVATKMVDHKRSGKGATNLQDIQSTQRDLLRAGIKVGNVITKLEVITQMLLLLPGQI
jgi:hypothetical protein